MRTIAAALARASAAAAVSLVLGCTPAPPPATPSGPVAGQDGVLAVVNGHAIREEDVKLAMARSDIEEPTAAQKRNVVETLIKKELIAQDAEALGLDKGEKYQEKLRKAQADLDAIRRKDLGDVYEAREVVDKATVPEEEVRAWFDAHKAELGYEYHVMQILRRDKKEIDAMKAELDAGTPFAEVAGKRYADVQLNGKVPWDLGWMRWAQMPEPWRESLGKVPEGGHSDVLEGEGGRYWIVQVVEKRAVEPDYAKERDPIEKRLQSEKAEALQSEKAKALRAKAKVEIAPELEKAK